MVAASILLYWFWLPTNLMNWQVTNYHWQMLNERLKNLRLAKGLTLQQVGDVFGISAEIKTLRLLIFDFISSCV
jgi:hypothetical protein